MTFGFSKQELISISETLLYVAAAAVVDYLAAHLKLLPLSPLAIAVITPLIKALKMFFDGKVS